MLISRHRILLTALFAFIYIFIPDNLIARQPGGQAGAFMRLGLGADRVAMGDCGTAMTGGGMNWYYNPAALPFQDDKQASFGYRFMSLDRKIMYAGFSTPLEPGAGLALGVVRAGTDEIDIRNSNGEHVDMLSHSENILHGSFALQPHRVIAIGISIKWLINAVSNILEDDKNLYAYGMSIDLGVCAVPHRLLKIGFQVRDIGARYTWETSELWGDEMGSVEDKIPLLIRTGAAWGPFFGHTLTTDVVIDPDRVGDDTDAVEPHFGYEFRREISEKMGVALRAGWNGFSLTLGLGLEMDLKMARARMDYGFYLEDNAPGTGNLIGWVFIF